MRKDAVSMLICAYRRFLSGRYGDIGACSRYSAVFVKVLLYQPVSMTMYRNEPSGDLVAVSQ